MRPIPPTDAEVVAYFPLGREAMAPPTFEIGFALSGTVSAGAYTAGVLDYILEAMDAWTASRAAGDADAPRHRVAISTLAGASGGAINGAIFLKAASFDTPRGASPDNPLFDAWAGAACVTLAGLLAPGLSKSGMSPVAILNTSPIENQVAAILADGKTQKQREYVTNPLRLIATFGNVTGIPYRMNFRGTTGLGLDMTAHSDYVRFALAVPRGARRPEGDPQARPDEYALSAAAATNWSQLAAATLATCAYPIVFDARKVDRTFAQLSYRAVLVPGGPGEADRVLPLAPVWKLLGDPASGSVAAVGVDGGTVDNSPLDVVHAELAGLAGNNPRDGARAHRALVLIDPFADAAKLATAPKSLFDIAGQVLSLFLQQARYRPEQVALAKDSTVFSRFLIAPSLEPGAPSQVQAEGSDALAGGKLAGFIGFLDPSFLKHDFELGRYDAFLFLTREFRVPPGNTVIAAAPWTPAQIETYTRGKIYDYPDQPQGERDYLPLIPLVASMRANPPAPPAKVEYDLRPDILGPAIEARLDYVYGRLVDELTQDWNRIASAAFRAALSTAWNIGLRGALRDKSIAALQDALKQPSPAVAT